MISKAKQLASIAAAGASAIVLSGGQAEASIVNSGPLNFTIGYTADSYDAGSGGQSHVFNSLASGPDFRAFGRSLSLGHGLYTRQVIISSHGHGASLGQVVSFGAACNCNAGGINVAGRYFGTKSSALGPAGYADKYATFRFNPGSGEEYGWIELSATETLSTSGLASDGPTVTIVEYAYDNSGATVTAGEGETPEPSSFAESALAALVLGAEGLRRWRKSRQTA